MYESKFRKLAHPLNLVGSLMAAIGIILQFLPYYTNQSGDTVSLAGMCWWPLDHAAFSRVFANTYGVTVDSANKSQAMLHAWCFLIGIAAFCVLLFVRKQWQASIAAIVVGGVALPSFLIGGIVKEGSFWIVFVIIYAIMLVTGIVNFFVGINIWKKDRKLIKIAKDEEFDQMLIERRIRAEKLKVEKAEAAAKAEKIAKERQIEIDKTQAHLKEVAEKAQAALKAKAE